MSTKNFRLKLWYADPDVLIAILNAFKTGLVPCLPVCEKIPEGTEVENVFWSESRRKLGVVLTHPSFKEFPSGEVIPQLEIEGFASVPLGQPAMTE